MATVDINFTTQIRAICEAHGIQEFALYGRYPQAVNEKGNFCPPDRLVWLEGETLVAEEAEYHFGRIGEGKKP